MLDLVTLERRQALEALVKTEGNGWLLPRFAPASVGWRYRELAASHHAAITMPDKLVDLLLELSS